MQTKQQGNTSGSSTLSRMFKAKKPKQSVPVQFIDDNKVEQLRIVRTDAVALAAITEGENVLMIMSDGGFKFMPDMTLIIY